jgi:hypothetical protein
MENGYRNWVRPFEKTGRDPFPRTASNPFSVPLFSLITGMK